MFDPYPDLEPDDRDRLKRKLNLWGCAIPVAAIVGAVLFYQVIYYAALWYRGLL